MPMLTVEQVKNELGLKDVDTIYKLRDRGDLKLVDISPTGSRHAIWRCDQTELDRFKQTRASVNQAAEQRQKAPPAAARRSRSGKRTVVQ